MAVQSFTLLCVLECLWLRSYAGPELFLAMSISFFALSTDRRVEMSIFKPMILLQICLGCPDNPVLYVAKSTSFSVLMLVSLSPGWNIYVRGNVSAKPCSCKLDISMLEVSWENTLFCLVYHALGSLDNSCYIKARSWLPVVKCVNTESPILRGQIIPFGSRWADWKQHGILLLVSQPGKLSK